MSTRLINTGIPAVHSGFGWAVPGTPPRGTLTTLAVAALSAPTQREARHASGEWPVPRGEMRSARRIRERLAEDAATLIRKRAILNDERFVCGG